MDIKQYRKLEEEKALSDDQEVYSTEEKEEDIYDEEARELETDDDEIDSWEEGWMKGYEKAK